METLNLQNHFGSPMSTYYQAKPEYQQELPQAQTKNRSSIRDRTVIKSQDQLTYVKDFAKGEKRSGNQHAKGRSSQSTRENSPNVSTSDSFAADFLSADSPEREYFIRCVIIGAENTGKHTLLNTNLPDSTGNLAKSNIDLMIRKKIQFKTTKKYHFWVNTLGETSETKEIIWKTYYKWATAFVFVYDMTNKESFKALEKAVESVLQVVPREKFFGILVGNKSDLIDEIAVDDDEVTAFKDKYGFTYFIETNSSIEAETSQLLPRIDTKLQLIFESI